MTLRPRDVEGAVLLKVKAVPGASRERIVGVLGDALKVAVAAPPEKGKANERICAVLAAALGVARRQVELVAGHSTPLKQVRITGTSADEVSRLLATHFDS